MEDQDHQQSDTDAAVSVTLSRSGQQHVLQFEPDATVADLAARVEEEFNIPAANQKFLVPKLGMLKAPLPNPDLPLAGNLDAGRRITLMGTSAAEIESLHRDSEAAATRAEHLASREIRRRQAPKAWSRASGSQQARDDATYTFVKVEPLTHLPGPERSLGLLKKLQADPGIRAAMRRHRFRVGLLTEMDPLSHTEATHEGVTRILGLNHNRGEKIELRLRTDAYDGYRDYRVIRKTLCHELAHNVHGPHDRAFWDLCHQIEREVDRGDWRSGGHTVGGDDADYYEPVGTSEEIAYDHGGWTGGSFVLGGGSGSGSSSAMGGGTPVSRREAIAKAAEERLRKLADAQGKRQEPDREGPPST